MAKKNEAPEQSAAVYRPAIEKIPADQVTSIPAGPNEIDGDGKTAKTLLAEGREPAKGVDPTQPEAGPYGPDADYVETSNPGVQAQGAGSSETPEAFEARVAAEEEAEAVAAEEG